MTSIITPSTPSTLEVSPSIQEFIENLNIPSDRIRQTLYQYPDVVEKLIEDLKTPLPDKIPNEVKVFYNGKLQQWFIFQPEYSRYFVEKVPNFEKVSFEEQIYIHYYFDGILAIFGVCPNTLIDRVTPENSAKIQEFLKV
jgi:hypothetical protein